MVYRLVAHGSWLTLGVSWLTVGGRWSVGDWFTVALNQANLLCMRVFTFRISRKHTYIFVGRVITTCLNLISERNVKCKLSVALLCTRAINPMQSVTKIETLKEIHTYMHMYVCRYMSSYVYVYIRKKKRYKKSVTQFLKQMSIRVRKTFSFNLFSLHFSLLPLL